MSAGHPPEAGRVGRGRPPVRSRFQPGQSGNSKGRPKGSRNLATLLEAELAQTVTITENGKSRRISKGALAVKQLVNQVAGAKANPRVTIALLKLLGEQAAAAPKPRDPTEPAASALGGEDDQALLRAFFAKKETTDEPE